ncbi:hypothetical protein QTO34_003654 [Cnephaeus nilssonii]|uniref:Follitropin subunit beta n=1 Tax=Cnephaeus nilssonii TaxID=3371016 RepID=A0AA40HRW5_CNENI|nr:hypothetical protein QTO34_003654 [Eptesicus nilssonii]
MMAPSPLSPARMAGARQGQARSAHLPPESPRPLSSPAAQGWPKDLVYKDPTRRNTQKVCTFKELLYETVRVPGCAHQADSVYTYPVATECHCGKCNRDSTDCTVQGLGPSYCSFSEIKE